MNDTLSYMVGLLVGVQDLPHSTCLSKSSASWEREEVDIVWKQRCSRRKDILVLLIELVPENSLGLAGTRVSPKTGILFYKTL